MASSERRRADGGDGESAVRELLREYVSAWNHHDPAAIGSLFVEDGDYVAANGTWWRGRDAIQTGHAETLAGLDRSGRVDAQVESIRALGDDAAIGRVGWRMQGFGGAVVVRNGYLLLIVRREQGKWWIVAGQNTDRAAARP
jgi:uncharacterized protein (TIGR02246 family)